MKVDINIKDEIVEEYKVRRTLIIDGEEIAWKFWDSYATPEKADAGMAQMHETLGLPNTPKVRAILVWLGGGLSHFAFSDPGYYRVTVNPNLTEELKALTGNVVDE